MDDLATRLRKELLRCGIKSESEAARRVGEHPQWLSRRLTGETDWKLTELQHVCDTIGLSYLYVTTGIEERDVTERGLSDYVGSNDAPKGRTATAQRAKPPAKRPPVSLKRDARARPFGKP